MYSRLSTAEEGIPKLNGEEKSQFFHAIQSMSKPIANVIYSIFHGLLCAFFAATWAHMTESSEHPEITDIFIPDIHNPLKSQRQTIELKRMFSVNILWFITILSLTSFVFNGWYAISAITFGKGVDDSVKYRSFESGITSVFIYWILALAFGLQNVYTLFLVAALTIVQHWALYSCEYMVFVIKRKKKDGEIHGAHKTVFKISSVAFGAILGVFLTEILRTIDGSSPDTEPFVIAIFFMVLFYHSLRHLLQYIILIDGELKRNPKRETYVYNGSMATLNFFFILTIQIVTFVGYRYSH